MKIKIKNKFFHVSQINLHRLIWWSTTWRGGKSQQTFPIRQYHERKARAYHWHTFQSMRDQFFSTCSKCLKQRFAMNLLHRYRQQVWPRTPNSGKFQALHSTLLKLVDKRSKRCQKGWSHSGNAFSAWSRWSCTCYLWSMIACSFTLNTENVKTTVLNCS